MAKIKGIEFAVDDAQGRERIFETFGDALIFAVGQSISTGRPVNVDVLAHSREAAEKWQTGGGEIYDEDTDASVFQRIVIRADDQGRVA